MKLRSIVLLGSIAVSLAACSKGNSSPDCGSCLIPLSAGNVWVYQDSVFDRPGVLNSTYVDSMTVSQSTTNLNGLNYYGVQDPQGWFGPSGYLAVNPINSAIFGLDSLNGDPFLFFGTALWDWTVLGVSSDFSNPVCIGTFTQYGFYNTANVEGYDCQVNIGYVVDCNNVTTEEIVYYVCPGVGVIRIEDYTTDRFNNLFLDYSQTLRSTAIR